MALWAVDRSGRTAVREWGATLTPALAADPDRAAELQPLLAATRGGGSATIHATGLDGWTTGWPGHGSGVRSFAWAADPVRLASGSEDSLVVWIDGRGRALVTGSGTIAGANALAWSPDGSRLATGGEDGQVRVWQADTRSEVMVFATDGDFTGMGAVHSLAWSPDGTWLAAGTTSGQVPVIDANSGQIRIIYEEGAPVLGIAWSADGTWIFTAVDAVSAAVGGRLHVWTLP
jgi:WD40 repeat protein